MTAIDGTERLPWLKWIDRFNVLLAIIGGVATIGLMLNVAADVIGRFFFNHPLPGTLDLTQYAWMPTLVSLGLGYALMQGEHLRVNLLTGPTGPRTQRIVEVVSMCFTLFTVAFFIWFGVSKAVGGMEIGENSIGTPWLEIWPYQWVVVIGMVGLFLQSIATLLRAITVAEFIPNDADEGIAALESEGLKLDEVVPEEVVAR